MKTAQEMTYDFMLALAPTLTTDDMQKAMNSLEDLDDCAERVWNMASGLTQKYLESL